MTGKNKLMSHLLTATVLLVAAVMPFSSAFANEGYGNCKLYGQHATSHITPAIPGQFTVLINLPAVGEFNGDTPATVTSGHAFCMAVNIAYRLGLDKVVLRNASFDSIVAGQNKDFDIALAMISVTKPRAKVVDFSTPYVHGAIGVAVRADSKLDAETIKSAKIGTQAGTTMVSWVQNNLKPKSLSVFPDTGSLFTALAAGNVDAVMTGVSVVLGQVGHSKGRLKIVGKYLTGSEIAGVYPKGSRSEKAINKIIADLDKEGVLADLEQQYLAPAWGGLTRAGVPVWKP